jgi:hypothetical protein
MVRIYHNLVFSKLVKVDALLYYSDRYFLRRKKNRNKLNKRKKNILSFFDFVDDVGFFYTEFIPYTNKKTN